MTAILKLALALWDKKMQFFLPLFFIPLGVMAFYYGYTPTYTASTVISIDNTQASTALLRHVEREESQNILMRRLTDETLLIDTARASGLAPNIHALKAPKRKAVINAMVSNTSLEVMNNEMLRINYSSKNKQEALKTLETLAPNFVDQLLAPERFKAEQALIELSEQIQFYNRSEKQKQGMLSALNRKKNESNDQFLRRTVRLEFETEKAAAQHQLAKKSYENMLEKSQGLLAINSRGGLKQNILRFEESPMIMPSTFGKTSPLFVFYSALLFGFIIGLISAFLSRLFDTTLSDADDIYTTLGLRVLGRIPHFGDVQNNSGVVSVHTPDSKKF